MKPEFKNIPYDPKMICWGAGNNAVGPRLLASVKLRNNTKKEDKEEEGQLKRAEGIYKKYIKNGQRFQPAGERGNRRIECKITYIHAEKYYVKWLQDNLSKEDKEKGYKPASGRFSINAMIRLFITGEIQFI